VARIKLAYIGGGSTLALDAAGVDVTPEIEERVIDTGPGAAYFET
jgi:hypothetical protein